MARHCGTVGLTQVVTLAVPRVARVLMVVTRVHVSPAATVVGVVEMRRVVGRGRRAGGVVLARVVRVVRVLGVVGRRPPVVVLVAGREWWARGGAGRGCTAAACRGA